MLLRYFLLFPACLLTVFNAFSQKFPVEMRISADGRQLLTGGRSTTGFYDESVIRNVNFQFAQPDYWAQLTNNYKSKIPILATMTVDGEVFDSVGVRFKGQTSYSQVSSQKKSFAVEIDFVKGKQDVMGYQTLNFNNCFLDPSFLREVMYLHLGRNHIPSAKGNFIHLTINGQNWGLYNNIQGLNGDYLKEWFLSDNGTRWRAERTTTTGGGPGGAGGGFGAGTSSLNWLGNDTTLYKPNYTLKTTHKSDPWTDLKNTCNALNNTPIAVLEDTLNKYLDLDRTLWFLATEIMFTDDDSYVFKGGMDYYLYWEAETGRMVPLEYDGNTCMDLALATSWSPFYKQTDSKFALTYKLFPIPAIRQRYLAHVRTILEDSFRPGLTDSLIDAYVAKIRPLVEADPKKIYSVAQFNTEITELKSFFAARRNYLLNNAEVSAVRPVIQSVSYFSENGVLTPPAAGKSATVTVKATSAAGVFAARLYYAIGLTGRFNKVEMSDDGLHDDGAANDGIYGASLPGYAAGTYVRYYVEVVNNTPARTVVYAPKGAEHDVYMYQVRSDVSSAAQVVINELMASNTTTAADQDGEYDDWVELFNTGNQTADLSGWALSDDPLKPEKWKFAAGTTLAPGAYLIVWCDENGMQTGLHANFKLSASGETVWLRDAAGTVVQEVFFGEQTTDKGLARIPNGTGNFVVQAPTFNANNSAVGVKNLANAAPKLRIFPNPTTGKITVETDALHAEPLEIIALTGRKVWEGIVQGRVDIDLEGIPSGIYFAKMAGAVRRMVVKR